ncbi:MAG: FecR domain-containing protein [Planctomycetes bacterium]|nr:FecR domain-containing protein [Planctomycetota bacterium]
MTPDAHHDELIDLLNQLREDCLPAAGEQRLAELLQDESLRRVYVQRMGLIADLRWQAIEGEQQTHPPAVPPTLPAPTVLSPARAFFRSAAEVFWHPIALLLIVGLFSAGILAYVFSTRPGEQPVGKVPPAGTAIEPVAKLVGTTDVQWQGAVPHDGDALTPGQRLILKRGSAEIAFNNQARLILVAPAELTIVDQGACRLAEGRLTAHVPTPAKGFQVHTPDGTVTDLGTEFGVVVRGQGSGIRDQGEERKVNHTSSTEVHVFLGKVEVGEVGSRKS